MNDSAPLTLTLKVAAITREADGIITFELVDPAGRPLPRFTAGAHVDVHIPGGFLRQYSLCNDPRETHRYVIAVQHEPKGRGGSRRLHDTVKAGDTLAIGAPRNNFLLHEGARRHRLIAGGIGVTPILAMLRHLVASHADWHLDYCTRDPARTAFLDLLRAPPFGERVRVHFDGGDPSKGLDVKRALATQGEGEHLYCCGPTGLMAAVKAASGPWAPGTVHFEYFVNENLDAGLNTAFQVRIASTGAVYDVPADKSIMQVLREHGHDIDSSCEEGICGTCATAVKDGAIDHRDAVLSAEEKASNRWMMVCCSRAKGGVIVLDL
ncbi:MAG: PDR/VanB family oxidoreductase [Alphaproteobacteria bacterium]